jgi:VWFA-related protein
MRTLMKFRSRLFALPLTALPPLVIAFSLTAPITAQTEPQAQFEGKVDVREVLLDVLVTDSRGNVIVGLGPKDFKVTEGGKPVELTGVGFYSNRRFLGTEQAAQDKGISPAVSPENRYFVLFFDDQREAAFEVPGLLNQQANAGKKTQEWVNGLLRNDYVAVVSWRKKLVIHQDFSRDHASIETAIKDAMIGKDPDNQWPSRSGDAEKGPALLPRLPKGNDLRDQTTTIYDALQVLAKATQPIIGRKNLMLFSLGFGQVDPFGNYLPDTRYFSPTIQALNDANVAVYTIDVAPTAAQHTMQDGLNLLANATGGRYYYNFTSFATPLGQIGEENNGYYLLAYRAEHPAGSAGYQEVEVRPTNPEFRLRARQGYRYGG